MVRWEESGGEKWERESVLAKWEGGWNGKRRWAFSFYSIHVKSWPSICGCKNFAKKINGTAMGDRPGASRTVGRDKKTMDQNFKWAGENDFLFLEFTFTS
jgi:hypothetical protein